MACFFTQLAWQESFKAQLAAAQSENDEELQERAGQHGRIIFSDDVAREFVV